MEVVKTVAIISNQIKYVFG